MHYIFVFSVIGVCILNLSSACQIQPLHIEFCALIINQMRNERNDWDIEFNTQSLNLACGLNNQECESIIHYLFIPKFLKSKTGLLPQCHRQQTNFSFVANNSVLNVDNDKCTRRNILSFIFDNTCMCVLIIEIMTLTFLIVGSNRNKHMSYIFTYVC